jgi:hypothetical protein
MASNRLEEKLERIRKDSTVKDFAICDAKDGDMGGGIPMPGAVRGPDGKPTGKWKTREAHLQQIRDIVRQDIVDLMLLSVSTLEILKDEGLFEGSRVGTAIRANDTTEIKGPRNSQYRKTASLPFRTAEIPHAMYGRLDAEPGTPPTLTDLGLYSVTFVGDAEQDREALNHYRDFRAEAEEWGFKHFLEVFNPNVGFENNSIEEIGDFVNDSILHAIAGVPRISQPQFLKMPFNGPKALTELAEYDPRLIVGILGGGAGTTRDTFELLAASQKYGARLVLFGRKINLAEHPLAIVKLMKAIVDGDTTPAEAVKAYHGELETAGVRPFRDLSADSEITEAVLKM